MKIQDGERKTSFIIKVLTYKRQRLTEDELLKQAISNLNTKEANKENLLGRFGEGKYKLLKYIKASNSFNNTYSEDIDFDKKTLFLIHGTFSSTVGSFGGTFENEFAPDNKILKKLIGV